MACSCDAVDRLSCFWIGGHESLEIGPAEHQQPAIGQRHDVGLTRPTREQSHFPEELPAAEPHRPLRQRHLDRAGSDEEDGVAAVSLADDAFVGDRKARAQQSSHAIELPFVES